MRLSVQLTIGTAEIFPMRVRAKAVSLSTAANWFVSITTVIVKRCLTFVFQAVQLCISLGCSPRSLPHRLEDLLHLWDVQLCGVRSHLLLFPRDRG